MDFNQVRYFIALADTLNFTRAAERCFVSQPALTQGIMRLEEELGGKLVLRDGRYTELTALGRGMRANFEQINQIRQQVSSTARAIVSGEVAELNIGVMCTIGPRIISEMLSDFQKMNPTMSIVLHSVTPPATEDMLLSGGLDAVFCANQGPIHNRLRYVELFEEPLVIAFPPGHEFSGYDAVSLEDVSRQNYIERLHCEFRQETLDIYKEKGLELNIIFHSEREDWIQCLVSDGLGVSLIPLYSLMKPEIEHRPVVDPSLKRKVKLAIVNNAVIPLALEKLVAEAAQYGWPSIDD